MDAKEIIESNPRAHVFQPRGTFDGAILGITSDGRLIYSENKMLIALQEIEGKTYEEALDYYASLMSSSAPNANRFFPIIASETT